MTTLKDLKKKLEEAQKNVASLEKEIASKTPRIKMSATLSLCRDDKLFQAVRKWAEKHSHDVHGAVRYLSDANYTSETEVDIITVITPDMLRSLADMMEENV